MLDVHIWPDIYWISLKVNCLRVSAGLTSHFMEVVSWCLYCFWLLWYDSHIAYFSICPVVLCPVVLFWVKFLLHSHLKIPTPFLSFWRGSWSDPWGWDDPHCQNLPGCDGEKHHHDAHRRLWWRATLPERENQQVCLNCYSVLSVSLYWKLQLKPYLFIFSVEALSTWRMHLTIIHILRLK